MDETRQAIARTAGELADRVRETVDWRLQTPRHPAASLGAAAAIGFMLGRALGPALRLGARVPLKAAAPATLGALPAAGLLVRLAGVAGLARELAFVPSLLAQLNAVIRPRRARGDRAR
ncbi:MAG TPA: hypothetical protein VEW27_18060 [Methylomirabilota bacterium]|nr:hypothetical protein [Methylomirabilota bacterium]